MNHPNVLLVVLDSVRAQNTSLHGNSTETTPYLESFAEAATTYTQARAPSIHSIASHASIFSGHHVEEHGVVEHESKLTDAASIWTTLSDDYEYTTGLFSPNVVVTKASNMSSHFDYLSGPKRLPDPDALTVSDIEGEVTPKKFLLSSLKNDRTIQSLINGMRYQFLDMVPHDPSTEQAEVYLSEFFDWSDAMQEPWAACINLMDAHYPYIAEPEFRMYEDDDLRAVSDYFGKVRSKEVLEDGGWWALEALEYLYEECIRQVDAAIGTLIQGLKKRDELEDTLIVITSDHGEAFGERSQVSPSVRLCDHSWGIHEVQTHVPLVVKHPGQRRGHEIDDPASLTAFPDVVLETLRGQTAPTFVPESGPVVSSTYRVPHPGEELPDSIDKNQYIGPWRAIYTKDSDVIKKTTHAEEGAVINIKSAQNYCVESREYPKDVPRVFSSMADAQVNSGVAPATEAVNERLKSLGYMR